MDELPCNEASLGRYMFRLDMQNPSVLAVEAVETQGCLSSQGQTLKQLRQSLVSVISDVSLQGPGSWDSATMRLTAMVRITNLSANDLDEPRMEMIWLTPTDAGVEFEQIHFGSGGAGSGYAFADIQAPPGANNSSAKQRLVIHDPQGISFSFAVDILADIDSPPGDIFPDADDDRFNVEQDEPAGDDCDDDDPDKFPEEGCGCEIGCDSCTPGVCCEEYCSGDCDPYCSAEGCDCYFYSEQRKNLEAICEPGSTCHLECSEAKDCSVEECEEGGTCDIDCALSHDCHIEVCDGLSTCEVDCTFSHDCGMKTCEEETSCSLTCSEGHDCEVEVCDDQASCVVDCRDSHNCGIKTCVNEANCSLICDANHNCTIEQCENASCFVSCVDTHTCALLGCRADSTCQLTCGAGVPTCNLDCQDDQSVVDCGNGVLVCSNTPCP